MRGTILRYVNRRRQHLWPNCQHFSAGLHSSEQRHKEPLLLNIGNGPPEPVTRQSLLSSLISLKRSSAAAVQLHDDRSLFLEPTRPNFQRVFCSLEETSVCNSFSCITGDLQQSETCRSATFPSFHPLHSLLLQRRIHDIAKPANEQQSRTVQKHHHEENVKEQHTEDSQEDTIWTWPNAISAARLLSGPPLAILVVTQHEGWALAGFVVAALSDWLDGYIARRLNLRSVLGSYLDPFADKVLIGCLAGGLYVNGVLPGWLVLLMLGRDVGLLLGAFVLRARSLQWQWRGAREFFRVTPGMAGSTQVAEMMQPLFVSKVNTSLQLALMGAALAHPSPHPFLMPCLMYAVAGTTTLSGWLYVETFFFGRIR
eukprot:TRINITY_DN35937_c0_g1_i1.p1 TRINITY_DN35937_c0_g1~~TRINITY_DN35937_c0_g1_i1.p1  ORF type:complete len:370 (-),score=26.66 TRINITY_DN35937_c0_g1_i1:347-1456(-)